MGIRIRRGALLSRVHDQLAYMAVALHRVLLFLAGITGVPGATQSSRRCREVSGESIQSIATFFDKLLSSFRSIRFRVFHRSLSWLRGGDKLTTEREMARMQIEAKEQNVSQKSIGLSDLFRDRATVKGLFITLGLFGGQQFAGIFAMVKTTIVTNKELYNNVN